MRLQVIHSHWLKRPSPHMQCYKRTAHTSSFDFANELRIKVQTRRRRRNRAPLARKNALVSLAVIRIGRTVDVRGKRYIAPSLEEFKNRPWKLGAPQVVLAPEDAYNTPRCCHLQPLADGFAGTEVHQGFAVRDGSLEEHFDAASRGLGPHKTRRDNPCVVENQEVPGAKEVREVTHGAIADFLGTGLQRDACRVQPGIRARQL